MQSRKYEVGDKVLTYYEEDCMWYPGQILSINRNGSYLVKWDVPEDGIEEVQVTSEHMRCALIPVRELEIGQKFSGVVFEINSFGAFVDIGAEEHGLLPIGRMATSWFNSTEEVLEEGDSVDVWISRKKDGHFSLTMVKDLIETDLSPFTDLKPDQWVTGVVKSIASFKGAFVTVSIDGISADGFLHVSELSTSFVSSVDQILSKGQEVRVRVLSVDVEAGRMILSMKPHTIKSMNRQAEPDRKHVMHGGAQSRLAALAKITSDQWLQGKVVRVIDIGAFVAVNPGTAPAFSEMGAVDGLLHESQMTGRVREGDMINVRIEALDVEKEKLKLSTKYSSVAAVGSDWYNGVVSTINTGGLVVALVLKNGDYETGFLPISQMPSDLKPQSLLIGQEVKVRLLSFRTGKITLSMLDGSMKSSRPSFPASDLSTFENIPPTKWMLGFVAHRAKTGLFITLELDGVRADALLRYGNMARMVQEVEVGQPVRVRIINLDTSQGKMEVSMLPDRNRQTTSQHR